MIPFVKVDVPVDMSKYPKKYHFLQKSRRNIKIIKLNCSVFLCSSLNINLEYILDCYCSTKLALTVIQTEKYITYLKISSSVSKIPDVTFCIKISNSQTKPSIMKNVSSLETILIGYLKV